MRSTKVGDWYITTPFYVGTEEQIAKMKTCEHPIWIDANKTVEEGYLVHLQRCTSCNAARSRYKPLGKDEHEAVGS